MPKKNTIQLNNQQERLAIASWIVGFVDGEGSFLVSLFRNKTTRNGWQIFPEFVITQGAKSLDTLKRIQNFFRCGKIFVNRRFDNHHEHLYRYCVRSIKDLHEKILPFFGIYKLQTAKMNDFRKFAEVLKLMNQRKHLTEEGFIQIQRIANTMNRKGISHR